MGRVNPLSENLRLLFANDLVRLKIMVSGSYRCNQVQYLADSVCCHLHKIFCDMDKHYS